MKILFCYPWLEIGGAPNTAISLAKGLRERGHEVFFFTKAGGAYESRLTDIGIPVVSAPHHSFLPALDHLNVPAYRILRETLIRRSIDVVHAFHPHSYFLSLFAAPPLDIPVVFTAVWFLYPKPFPAYRGRVIFVAEEFRDQAGQYFEPHARELIVLPNRVDLDMFHPGIDHADFSRRMQLPAAGWKLAFMSRVDSLKFGSLQYAIGAVRILAQRGRPVTLAIAGDGPMIETLRGIAAEANSEGGRTIVRLVGSILETPAFLSWADVVLGIGRSSFEGMACGKPTLVVGEKGLAGIVGPDTAAELMKYNFAGRNISEPVAPELLAGAVERIMDEENYRRDLSAFARDFVMKHYDYRVGAERLEGIYHDALADPPLGAAEKRRIVWTNFVRGYMPRYIMAWRIKLRAIGGR
jgi:glycosyltransferase involved in cell wall biosynthesis